MTSRSQKPASAGSERSSTQRTGRPWASVAAAVVLVLVAGGVAAVMLTGDGGGGSGAGTSAPPPAQGGEGIELRPQGRDARRCSTRSSSTRKAGDTICLAAGQLRHVPGRREAGHRDDPCRSAGAKARMALDFDGVANLRIENVTIPSATIRGPTRNLTIADSRFTGIAVVNTDAMAGANVVFDGNTHSDIDTCLSCLQGRLNVESATPAGPRASRSATRCSRAGTATASAQTPTGSTDHRQRVPRTCATRIPSTPIRSRSTAASGS